MKRFAGLLPAAIVMIAGFVLVAGFVEYDGQKAYITDRTGERWDVSQAALLGFVPEKFQYGIGKDAFTPLDDSHVKPFARQLNENHRVIGVTVNDEAHAYSVRRLRYHEIANTNISGMPIAAGF